MPPLVIVLAVIAAIAIDIYLIWRLRGRETPKVLSDLLAKPRISRDIPKSHIRWDRTVEFVVGGAFIIAAHALLSSDPPIVQLLRVGEWLSDLLLLDVANPVNTIVAVSFLVVGIVSVAKAVRPSRYPGPETANVSLRRARGRRAYRLIIAAVLLLSFLLWQLSSSDPPSYLPILWVAALTLIGAAAYIFDRQNKRPLRPEADRWDLILLFALVAGGLVIGSHRLTTVPFSMVGDEGRFYEVASSIATGELQPSFFGSGVYSYPIVSSIYQGLILRIFGLSLWSWRFASALIAVAAVVPTYLLARESFDRRIAVLSGSLMIVMPYFIAIERLGYNNSQSLLPVALAVYLVYVGLRRSSALYLTLGGVAAGLGFYTYTAGRLAVVIGVAIILLALVAWRKNRFRTGLTLSAVFLLGFTATVAPRQYHGLVAEPSTLDYKAFESLFPNLNYALDLYELPELERDFELLEIDENTFFLRLDLYAQLLVRGIVRTGLALSHPKLITSHYIAGPLAGPLGGTLLVVGIALTLVGYRQSNYQLILIWISTGLLLLSALNTFPPRPLHIVPVIPAISILMALGLAILSDFLATLLPKKRRIWAAGIGASGLLLVSVTGLQNYFETGQNEHPPNVEDLIAFTGINLEAPRELIYVSPSEELLEFEPWILSRIPNRAQFQNVDVLMLEDRKLSANSAVTVFFEEQNSEEVRQWVQDSLGDRAVLESHRTQGRVGHVLTYSFTPGAIPQVESQQPREPISPPAWLTGFAVLAWTSGLIFALWRRFLQPRRFKRIAVSELASSSKALGGKVGRSFEQWWLDQRLKLSALPRSLQHQILSPTTGAESESVGRGSTKTIVGELSLIAIVILIFSTQYLDMDPEQLLPGHEYGVLSYPDQVLYRSIEEHGTFPLWNPYIRSGHPYLGDPFAHPFNPISTVPVLLLGVANGYKLAVFASLILAAIGMWLLGRVLGLNRAVRLWSAILYALNGQAIARFIQGQYLFIFGFAWIPFVIAALLVSLKTRKRSHYALAAIAFAMLYFTGTSYYPFYMALVLSGLGVGLLVMGGRFRSGKEVWTRIKPMVFIGILALGLVAVQLLPAVEMRPHLVKPTDPDLRLSIPLREVVVSFTSNSMDRTDLLVHLPPQEFYAYIGYFPVLASVLAIPAALFGRQRRAMTGFALLLAFVLIWSSIAHTPLASVYKEAEFLHQFRYTSRTLVFGVLALVSLGGFGLTWILDRLHATSIETAKDRTKRILYSGLLLLMIFSALSVVRENLRFVSTRSRNMTVDASVDALLAEMTGVADVSIPISTGWHVAAGTRGVRYWDAWYGFDFFPPAASTEWQLRDAPNYLLQPSAREVYYDDAEAVQEIDGNVIYEIQDGLPYAFLIPASRIQPIAGLEITEDEVFPLEITHISPNEIHVLNQSTAVPGWVVVRTSFYPGWTVTVDSEPRAVEAVGEFIGTRVVPGTTDYAFRFQSPVFKLGVAISLYSLLVVILIIVEPRLEKARVWSRFRATLINAAQSLRNRD